MTNNKVVVVTGCLGFIGRYVTTKLLEDGWSVYAIDKQTYVSTPGLVSVFKNYLDGKDDQKFEYIKKDIKDVDWIPDCDLLINIAAESHVDNSIRNSQPFVSSNIDGVRNLLELVRAKRGSNRPLFFQFSTDEVYGDIEEGSFKEGDHLNPSNPYAASKASADLLVTSYARTYGIDYIIFRPTNNYGIGQYPEKLIPFAVSCLKRGKKIPIHNQGTPSRNWLHVEDTAEAVMDIIDSGRKNEIFNCEGGFEQSNEDTVKLVLACFFNEGSGNSVDALYDKHCDFSYSRPGQDVRYALDDSKLRSIGWKPKKVFDEEIKEIVDHYKNYQVW